MPYRCVGDIGDDARVEKPLEGGCVAGAQVGPYRTEIKCGHGSIMTEVTEEAIKYTWFERGHIQGSSLYLLVHLQHARTWTRGVGWRRGGLRWRRRDAVTVGLGEIAEGNMRSVYQDSVAHTSPLNSLHASPLNVVHTSPLQICHAPMRDATHVQRSPGCTKVVVAALALVQRPSQGVLGSATKGPGWTMCKFMTGQTQTGMQVCMGEISALA